MIREAPVCQSKYSVIANWPLFMWTRCHKCRRQYRRQKGWAFVTGPYTFSLELGSRGVNNYICIECAPTKERAEIVAEQIVDDRAPASPPQSPPPPPARSVKGITPPPSQAR